MRLHPTAGERSVLTETQDTRLEIPVSLRLTGNISGFLGPNCVFSWEKQGSLTSGWEAPRC